MDVKKIYTLRNGIEIPGIGFGTWQAKDDAAVNCVKSALEAGYRHIDTATLYKNEGSVGQAIAECGLKREDVFITSKLWNSKRGYDKTMAAFETTLETMGLDYLDLYLIHWPATPHRFENWNEINLDTWKAITELYKAGRIRAIGVSNFLPHHLESLMQTEVQPMIDQIEYHPGYLQQETVDYCQKNGIQVEAWSPLGNGQVLNDAFLASLSLIHI